MANLSQKSTDGRLSFVKYVSDNKRLAEIEFEIEKGETTPIFTKKGTGLIASIKEYKAGTKFKIIDTKLYEISGKKLAKVKLESIIGFLPISKIRKPTSGNGTQYEDEVVDEINRIILENGGSIDIKIKGSSALYKNIAYAIKVDSSIKSRAGVKGDPKADIILCEDKKNPIAKNSIFISHKKEGGPEAFQQYGGISPQAGIEIYNNKFVQKFLGAVASSLGSKTQLPAPMMLKFKDDKLSNMSIYGPEFGSAFSLQHTNLIGQGHPKLAIKGKFFELDFSSHMSLSGDLSHFTGGYTPVLGATFRAGRGFEYKGKRYSGARIGIYPQKLIETRAGLIEL